MSAAAPASLWRNPDFLRLWIAQSVSQTGSAVTMVALPLICVVQLQATPQQMGLLLAAESAPLLLLRVPAAAWADASARRVPVMAACSLLAALLVASIPLAWFLGALHFWMVLGVGVAMGALSAVGGMFAAPTVPRIVAPEQLVDANGKFSVTRSIADVSGRSLAGLLISLLSAPLAMIVDAASFLAAAALTWRVRVPEEQAHAPAEGASASWGITRGFALLAERPLLGVGVGMAACLSLANGMVSALIILYMTRELGFSASFIGLLMALGAGGGIAAGLLVGPCHKRLGTKGTVKLAVALLTCSFALLPFARPGWLGVVACVSYDLLGSFGAPLLIITIFSEVPNQVPPHAIARVMAAITLVPEAAAMTGSLLGGFLGTKLGIPSTFGVGLALALLSNAVLLLVRRLGERRRAATARPSLGL